MNGDKKPLTSNQHRKILDFVPSGSIVVTSYILDKHIIVEYIHKGIQYRTKLSKVGIYSKK